MVVVVVLSFTAKNLETYSLIIQFYEIRANEDVSLVSSHYLTNLYWFREKRVSQSCILSVDLSSTRGPCHLYLFNENRESSPNGSASYEEFCLPSKTIAAISAANRTAAIAAIVRAQPQHLVILKLADLNHSTKDLHTSGHLSEEMLDLLRPFLLLSSSSSSFNGSIYTNGSL